MKITRNQLRQLIQEELGRTINEQQGEGEAAEDSVDSGLSSAVAVCFNKSPLSAE